VIWRRQGGRESPGAAGSRKLTYKDAGVSIEASERALELIKEKVRNTFRREVIGDIGSFAGLFQLDLTSFEHPVLVASTDGVGTKLLIAQMMGRHDTIGRDLVAMCVDDIVCAGAEPLFFLDYISCSPLEPPLIDEIIEGIAAGCREAHCALIGGEMAEHPGVMGAGRYDLAGFAVGIVDRSKIIDGSTIGDGDVVIGLESGGLMSNGYSLARKVLLETAGYDLQTKLPGIPHRLGDELLKPSPIFSPAILDLVRSACNVKGIAHVTGGGIATNLARVLPPKTEAIIDVSSWDPDPIFQAIADAGSVEPEEMFNVFNMGIGMLVVIPEEETRLAIDLLRSHGHHAHLIGHITKSRARNRVVLEGLT
jgi:phosphoribosylformylglycinamidine cyclo-ligase